MIQEQMKNSYEKSKKICEKSWQQNGINSKFLETNELIARRNGLLHLKLAFSGEGTKM